VPKHVAGDVRVRDLEQVTKAAFGQRRKMVRQSLKATGVPVERLLGAAGLKGDERAETLPVEAFLQMAKVLRA
jgi:16S rRNA (adenine1518-N6/adenine1519-N6)-dimethyltransferase